MAKYTNDELLEAFGEMTLVELSEFVKAFEEKFDVEAAAPVAAVAAVVLFIILSRLLEELRYTYNLCCSV